MQGTLTRNAFQRSLTSPEFPTVVDSSVFDLEDQNMIRKAQYFCRIGMGSKSIEAMSNEARKKITTYVNDKIILVEEEPLSPPVAIPGKPHLLFLAANNGLSSEASNTTLDTLDQDREDWAKRSTIRRALLLDSQRLSKNGNRFHSEGSSLRLAKGEDCTRQPVLKCEVLESDDSNSSGSTSGRDSDDESSIMGMSGNGSEGDFVMTKTDEEARHCYYDRLINMKILRLTPSKKNQSICIFDWDDTLLCTSYITNMGIKNITSCMGSVMRPLDEIVSRLLEKAAAAGHVFIVTNAQEGWVQYSAKTFLPKTAAMIEERNTTIISARTCYEGMYPGENGRWKREAFTSLVKQFEKDVVTNLICMGDSEIEIDAAHVMAKMFDKAITKTIKLKENPRPEDMVKQLSLVVDKFEQIFVSLKNSTIKLEKK